MEVAVLLASLFAKLDSGVLDTDKVDVEEEECSDDETKNGSQDVRCHYKVGDFVIKGIGMAHSS